MFSLYFYYCNISYFSFWFLGVKSKIILGIEITFSFGFCSTTALILSGNAISVMLLFVFCCVFWSI